MSKVSSLISVLDDMLDGEKEIDTDVMLQQKAEMEIEAERLANENEIIYYDFLIFASRKLYRKGWHYGEFN